MSRAASHAPSASASASASSSSSTQPLSPRASLPPYARRASGLASPHHATPSSASAAPTSSFGAAAASLGSAVGVGSSAGGGEMLDRPRDKFRQTHVGSAALAFLYAEVVRYTQARVTGIAELERKLSLLGYSLGSRLLQLVVHRLEQPLPPAGQGAAAYAKAGNPRREQTRLLPALLFVHTHVYRAAFGKAADSLERSTERNDEYMISTNEPLFSRAMQVPKEMSQLSVEAVTAGIVEAALDGLGFPARVTAHHVPTAQAPLRTTILVKLSREVMEREEALGPA